MSQNERRLILAIDITAKLEHRNALHRIRQDDDRGKEVNELHFPAGEDRATCDAELMAASAALVFAACGDRVRVYAAAARANWLTIGPAHPAESFIRLLLTAGIDLPEADCAGCRAEEKVARHHHLRYV